MLPIFDAVSGFMSGTIKPILDKFVPDASERLKIEQAVSMQASALITAQLAINKEEARSSSVFVAGWRPFIGWVCGASLAYSVIGYTFLNWLFGMIQLYYQVAVLPLPQPDMTITFEILTGMLGLGTLRTYEKFKGVAR